MGKTRKGLQAAGIGAAAASVLFFGQAGAAHAPVALPSPPVVNAVSVAAAVQSPKEPVSASARPLENLRIKIPSAKLRLSPAVERTSYPRLALGPFSYPDGALDLPGRIKPEAPQPQKPELPEVGHSVSAPTAIRLAGPFGLVRGEERPGANEASHALAGLPLVSSAHAANADSGGEAVGGPLTPMPIHGPVLFENGAAILTEGAQKQLDRMVETVRAGHAALEVVAYGGERQDRKPGEARRLALRRGLAVRSYLMSRGIDQERVSVRPMSDVRDGGPQARVDVFYAFY